MSDCPVMPRRVRNPPRPLNLRESLPRHCRGTIYRALFMARTSVQDARSPAIPNLVCHPACPERSRRKPGPALACGKWVQNVGAGTAVMGSASLFLLIEHLEMERLLALQFGPTAASPFKIIKNCRNSLRSFSRAAVSSFSIISYTRNSSSAFASCFALRYASPNR
jgi:hypothetical protein